MQRIVTVAFLLIQMKNCKCPQKRLDEQQQTTREVLNKVLQRVPSHSPLSKIPALTVRITMFSVQMVTSGVANRFNQHGLRIAPSIVTYIIVSGMSVFSVSVQRMSLEILSLLTFNTPGGITTYIELSVMPT